MIAIHTRFLLGYEKKSFVLPLNNFFENKGHIFVLEPLNCLHSAYNLFNIFRSEEDTIFELLSIFIGAISCVALPNFHFANL